MKNLSKVLSLVLALAMVLGVFCIGAGAAFADAEDINYDEAVDVLAAVKILEGDGTSFNPKGNVTRAEAACIIARVLLGRTLADELVTDAAPFADVAATHWAAGEIAYCVEEGIIAGIGDGKFDPNGNVTGYALAKMLLVALGFDAAENGLVGANWQINTAKLAIENKLFAGNLGADYTKAATREEASLYAFNAMKWSKGGDVVERVYGVIGFENQSGTLVPQYGWIEAVAPGTGALTAKHNLVSAGVTAVENGGQAGHYWYVNKDGVAGFNAVKDVKIGTYADEAITATFAPGTKYVDIAKALGVQNNDALSYTIENYTNGTADSVQTGSKTGAWIYTNYAANVVPNGVTVDVVVTEAGTIRLIVNVYYLGVIGALDVTKDTNTDDVDDRVVNVNRYTNGSDDGVNYALTAKNCAAFEAIYAKAAALAPSSYLYYVIQPKDDTDPTAGLMAIDEAATITGKMTAKTAYTYTINGKVYGLSATAAGLSIGATGDFTTDAVYYLDNSGSILYKTATPSAAPNYVFLEDFATYNKASTGLAETAGYYMQAKLVMLDGTTQIVDVASVQYDADGVVGGTVTYTLTGANSTTKVDSSNYSTVDSNLDANLQDAYTYTVNADGTYNLTWANTADAASGDIVAEPVFATGLTAYNTTKFVVRTATGNPAAPYAYAAYTGYANLPVSATNTLTAVVTGNAAANVYYVFGTTSATASQPNYVYITSTDCSETYDAATLTSTYTFNAIVDGAPTTVATTSSTVEAILDNAVGMYSVKYTNGLITAVAKADGTFATNGTDDGAALPMTYVSELAKDGTVKIAGDAKAYNDSTKVYIIDSITSAVKTAAMTDIAVKTSSTANVFVQYVKAANGITNTATIAVIYAVQ